MQLKKRITKVVRSVVIGFLSKIVEARWLSEEPVAAELRLFAAQALNLVPSDLPFGTPLFDALNQKQPAMAFEGVLLREEPLTGQLQVYLTQRSLQDSVYPSEFHAPGSGVRNKENWSAVSSRVARNEYKVPLRKLTVLLESGKFFNEPRGWYYSVPCLVELEAEPLVGKWYDINDMPENTVPTHRDYIIPVVVAYWQNREKFDRSRAEMREALRLDPASA